MCCRKAWDQDTVSPEQRHKLLSEHKLQCPLCKGRMLPRLRRSDSAPFWGCERFPSCKSTHGAHPNGRPLGIPGTPDTKAARRAAHAAFDPLWEQGYMHRNAAYDWLAKELGIPRRDVHIGAFSREQCERVTILSTAKLAEVKADPNRGDRDMIRALLAERFGHGRAARRTARRWLGVAFGLDHVAVHELSGEQCRVALELLDATRLSSLQDARDEHVADLQDAS